jgi:trehalose 6-phosphate phosphatase
MRYALSPPSVEILYRLVRSKALLAFDFDGTLAPIAASPKLACMRPGTRDLLRRLAKLRTCVVLSGRSREDLRGKLGGTGVLHLAGNHGAEPWRGAGQIRKEVSRWERIVASGLPRLAGVWIENKSLSLTIHYRQCRRKREAREGVAEAVRPLCNVRLIEGKESVSIVSQRAPHKGTALLAAAARLGFDKALYVGDDETDEDVFALSPEALPVFSIRVGRRNRSHASYYLRNQEEVDELLSQLLHASLRG